MTDQPVSRGPYCKLCWDYGCSHPHTGRDAPAAQVSDLDAIETRANAATPGPWNSGQFTVVGGGTRVADTANPASMTNSYANTQFIAHARTDVPALVAEVRRLRAELAPYEALQLGHTDGRLSATCPTGEHPTWLRRPDDPRSCPWCRLAEYVGYEPTIREEMAELSRRLDAVDAVCDSAAADTGRGTNVPGWVATVRAARHGTA